MSFYYLARFRADPTRVRIRVRRVREGLYRATFERRDSRTVPMIVTATHPSPIRALVLAFQMAEVWGFEGLDRHMQWTYRHPQGRAAFLAQKPCSGHVTQHRTDTVMIDAKEL